MSEKNNKIISQEKLQINVPQQLQPSFANSVQVNITNEEVVLQFVYVRPATKQGVMVSEIVLTPQHAMRLQKSLDDTLKKHFTPKNI